MYNSRFTGRLFLVIALLVNDLSLFSQPSWFIDGYHGGIWGHYPRGYTGFITDQLQRHPQWKINLEIEPVTWDAVQADDALAYAQLQQFLADTSVSRRIEYVNPAYGQSYFFNTSGESMIRQFAYGIKKLRAHFPLLRFTTYSSEEPCFTSALPQILTSFGFKYAALKNPNTCWGGYTRAFGGELIRWTGPDGSWMYTVPRYASEALEKNSTWQTTAWFNSKAYIDSALAMGIRHPVGMCLQDAGWHNGPWLGNNNSIDPPPVYTTWHQYVEQVADTTNATPWQFSQEDVLVSLVWGAQALQRIAQQVRHAENRIVATEKMTALAVLEKRIIWPQKAFDEAWQNLLLAQHHDCWIVPYNGSHGDTWVDKVQQWTKTTERICDSIACIVGQAKSTTVEIAPSAATAVRLVNTTAINRHELVCHELPAVPQRPDSSAGSPVKSVWDGKRYLPVQWIKEKNALLFKAAVPSAGYSTYQFSGKKTAYTGAHVTQHNGVYILETDLYRMVIDPAAGGAVKSLISKKLDNREWVNTRFNTLQGNFFDNGRMQAGTGKSTGNNGVQATTTQAAVTKIASENFGRQTTASQPAAVTILENGPLRVRVQINTTLAGHPVQQVISLVQGEPRIDCSVQIDWQQPASTGNDDHLRPTGIGNDYKQHGSYDQKEYKKAFYNDRDKLLLLFPLNIKDQKIYKNAPFDVTASKLNSTFFTTWDSIRNNIILDWVDVAGKDDKYGMALFTDHTTAYTHDKDGTLGLVVQYAGRGLWGRNYTVDGPTKINYSLLPHAGNWEKAGIEEERVKLAEPLRIADSTTGWQKSNVRFDKKGWEIASMTIDGSDLLVRIYHAAGADAAVRLYLQAPASTVTLEELDGRTITALTPKKTDEKTIAVDIKAPRFGIRTIRFHSIIQ